MTVRLDSKGVFKTQCGTCKSWITYEFTDTFVTDNDSYVKCVVCEHYVSHNVRNFHKSVPPTLDTPSQRV